jgi:lipopolysaccharide biosynthesis protein
VNVLRDVASTSSFGAGRLIRPIAIYLPQFHPIPENDEWWGKGFTEWTNVVRARPLYKGHYQPHLPADLGFYDLRLAEVREAQAQMARQHLIHGFCYYHYWFNGRRILERPFQEVFQSGKPEFPFMLCWANENWTRIWDGSDNFILLQQNYCLDDDIDHIRALIPYFRDSRYIRIDGRPVFAIYNSTALPDAASTTNIWREEARKHGLELYLCRFERGKTDFVVSGFDATIEFQPRSFGTLKDELSLSAIGRSFWIRAGSTYNKVFKQRYLRKTFPTYKQHIDASLSRSNEISGHKLYRCVCPGWDNTPRRKNDPVIIDGSTPELFAYWVKGLLERVNVYSDDENLFFINAWNEWAEGNHMEPCQKWGKAYLEAFKSAFNDHVG